MEQKPENPLWAHLPERIEAIKELGGIWARSGAIKADRIEQGQIAVAYCMSSGISLLEFLATYHPNMGDGRPQKQALACLAQFRLKGGKHKRLTESDDNEKAILELSFEGFTVKVEFNMNDAKQQGLVRPGSNWVKIPAYMLRARCITTAIGMLAPEIVAGADAAPDEAPLQQSKGLVFTPPKDPPAQATPEAEEEKKLAEMGLAPVQPDVKPTPRAKPAKRKSISVPPPGDEIGPGETPCEPPGTIEPQGFSDPKPTPKGPVSPPEMESAELDPEIVDQMGNIFSGNFLKVANWMIKEGWIPPADTELQTETKAVVHLRKTLPMLSKQRAKKVITQKMAFMRAVETIEP